MKSKRYAHINVKRCVACGACQQECPREAIAIIQGCYAQVDKALCIGCGKCANICPAGSVELQARDEKNE